MVTQKRPKQGKNNNDSDSDDDDESSHMHPDPLDDSTPTNAKRNQQQQQQQQQQQKMRNQRNNNDEEADGEEGTSQQNVKYRRYLIDRSNGTSRLGKSKPPCSACFVPLPVVWLADWIEQNCVFEFLGRFGCFDGSDDRARTIFIGLGLICNILATGLSFIVLFAMSTQYDHLQFSAFTSASVGVFSSEKSYPSYYLRVGLKAVSVDIRNIPADWPSNVTQEVILFDDFCEYTRVFLPLEECAGCANASSSMIFTVFVAFIMNFPSITTSVLRLYPHYDCNCQKVFASFAAVISVGFAIYTFMIYQYRCFRTFGQETVCLTDPDNQTIVPNAGSCRDHVYTNFFAGPGWICLSVTCGLKILDMLFNFVIPTPSICRDREEQRQYELLVKREEEREAAASASCMESND